MTPLASFAEVLQIVVGVLLSLSGLSIALMGVIAMARRRWKKGAIGVVAGVALIVAGFLLVGVIG